MQNHLHIPLLRKPHTYLEPPHPYTYAYLPIMYLPSTSLYHPSRELMPGIAQEADKDDRSLDQSFRADKIEFVLVSRKASKIELERHQQVTDVNQADWDIPPTKEYDDAMGMAIDEFTRTDRSLIHVINWSSVNKTTETGVFSIKTGALKHIEDFRDIIRRMFSDDARCYETFPRLALIKKFQLSAYFPKNCSKVCTQKLCDFLMDCNEGLRGEIRPVDVKYFPTNHARHGARIAVLSGTQEFLDSLQRFPKNFAFDIKMANVYIRGGTRTDEARSNSRRPKITRNSIEELVKRNMESLLRAQTATLGEDDKLSQQMNGAKISPEMNLSLIHI